MKSIINEIYNSLRNDYDYSDALEKIEEYVGLDLHGVNTLCGDANSWFIIGDYLLEMDRTQNHDGEHWDIDRLRLYNMLSEEFDAESIETAFVFDEISVESIETILNVIKSSKIKMTNILSKVIKVFEENRYEDIYFDGNLADFLGANNLCLGSHNYLHVSYNEESNEIILEKICYTGYDYDIKTSLSLDKFNTDEYKDIIKDFIVNKLNSLEALYKEFTNNSLRIEFALEHMAFLNEKVMISVDENCNGDVHVVRSVWGDYIFDIKTIDHFDYRGVYYRTSKGTKDEEPSFLKLDLEALETLVDKVKINKLDLAKFLFDITDGRKAGRDIRICFENNKLKLIINNAKFDMVLDKNRTLLLTCGNRKVGVDLNNNHEYELAIKMDALYRIAKNF